MKTRNRIKIGCALTTAVMTGVLSAGADPIDVPNHSFEKRATFDPFGDGIHKYPQPSLEDWRYFEATGNGGPARIGNPPLTGLTTAADGDYIVRVVTDPRPWVLTIGPTAGVAQLLTETFNPVMTYTLTVKVARYVNDASWNGYVVQLAAGGVSSGGARYQGQVVGGTVIAEDWNTQAVPPAAGVTDEWVTSTVVYTPDPADAGLAGLPLQIRLLAIRAPDDPSPQAGCTSSSCTDFSYVRYAAFDDVHLKGIEGLSIFKSVSAESVNLDHGETNLVYTLGVLNSYTVAVSGVVVTDTLPEEVSFISANPPAVQTNGNDYIFDVGALEPGSNAVITIDVTVTSTIPSVVTNFAWVITTNTNVAVTAAVAAAETILFRPTDLQLIKTASTAGSNLTYTLTVTNLSVSVAENVVVVDTLPLELTYQTAMPFPTNISGNDYTFNLGLLPAMSSTSITLMAFSTSTVPILVTNVATVTTTTFEDVLTNNTARVVSPVGSTLDLTLTKTVNPTNLVPGTTNLIYTIDVGNLHTSFVCGVVVTDSLPVGVFYLFADPPATETNGNSYVFNLGCMAPGANTSIVINAIHTSAVKGITLTNWANVSTTNQEVTLVNNRDFALTTVPPACSTNDTDGDGMSDCEEECAGTDPMDPNSFLWLQIQRTGISDVQRLTFPTSTGRTYWVESNTNLYSNVWTTVISNLPGLGTDRIQTHTSSNDRIYYRIGVTSP